MNSRTLLLVLVGAVGLAQTTADPQSCMPELRKKWNRFATDANQYVQDLGNGVKNVHLQKMLDPEWKAVQSCECW